MTSHYRNTIFVVYVLFCLFITSSSALSSFIHQFTDDFNTTLQQEVGSGPIQNLDVDHKNQKISSQDHKISVSNVVKGLRDHRPSSYSLQIESFNALLRNYLDRYESRPFAVGGYNWKLVVYPNGNYMDSSSGYLSLYVAIDYSTTPVAQQQEVHVDLRFYIFNKNERKYLTIQDTDVWKFSASKPMWGFPQVFPVDTFKDVRNGYLYDGDHCEFGVDVTIPSVFQKSELLSVTENFFNPRFTWSIRGYSTLLKDYYKSDVISIGGRSWNILVYPNGYASAEGKALTMYLTLSANEKFSPYERIYVRAILRVLNQRKLINNEASFNAWYSFPGASMGSNIISLADLRDPSKGFIVNDMLMVQAEVVALSSTKYFPS